MIALCLILSANLTDGLLAALNAKDRPTLLRFANERMDGTVAPEARVQRMWPIVEQGAPFTLIKMVDQTPTSERALIQDRNKENLALIMEIKDGKIARLMIREPDALTAPAPQNYRGWQNFPALVNQIRKDTGIPGLMVAYRRGANQSVNVSGERLLGSGKLASSGDVWHIGSVAKCMTATMVARLIEQGKLRWNSTLGDLLKGYPMRPEYAQVTVLQLMQHRSGLPQDMNYSGAQVSRIVGTESDPVKIRERYIKDVLMREGVGPAGAQFRYSNAGYATLGHLAEKLTGKPYETLMEGLLFGPLKMTTAHVGDKGMPNVPGRPGGHVSKPGGGWQPFDMGGKLGVLVAPAGNVYASGDDLLKFAALHLNGLRGKDGLLKSTTIKKLHEGQPEGPGAPAYACGWSLGPLDGTAFRHGHNGSNGTMRAELAIFPDQNLIVASVGNAGGEAEPSPALQAVQAVAQRYAPAKPGQSRT